MELATRSIESPIGPLLLAASPAGLTLIWFGSDPPKRAADAPGPGSTAVLDAAERELASYFDGELTEFTVPVDLSRSSQFAHRVLAAVTAIPYGATATYREIADRVGQRDAVRAVGRANATNPVPLVVPCHRVIGSDGALTGYGGGLTAKRWLLDLESGRQALIAEPGR
jgi:methylated-DNA-[protein]-cysteine S-methyltransferase